MNILIARTCRFIRALLLSVITIVSPFFASAASQEITTEGLYWIDTTGSASIEEVAQIPESQLTPLQHKHSFSVAPGAVWVRLALLPMDPSKHWFVLLEGASFIDMAQLHQPDGRGGWRIQSAGDHIAVAKWPHPNTMPAFELNLDAPSEHTWLRLANDPAPLFAKAYLTDGASLQKKGSWTLFLVGAYLGAGLLALFLCAVHMRLYAERAFVAYFAHVATMLGFQASFTGVGGYFFWPNSAIWNDAAPSIFMLLTSAAGVWFVREVCMIVRYRPRIDLVVVAWSIFGCLYPFVHLGLHSATTLNYLLAYGLLSAALSTALCVWAWRQGDRYAGWVALALLPVHLAYPFPTLRMAGLVPDTWMTQYAVLIGSAIEIPLLLYVLHRRAKEFSENRARVRALDSADPLTGLPIKPIFYLRLQDAIRRSRRFQHQHGLLLVELVNHTELRTRHGSETSDRALVVSAARLTRVVRDVDTVCRVGSNRFAILIEGPRKLAHIKLVAQHAVAKGLEPGSTLPDDANLRFRVVSSLLPPERGWAAEEDESEEARRIMAQLQEILQRHPFDPRKLVTHLNDATEN